MFFSFHLSNSLVIQRRDMAVFFRKIIKIALKNTKDKFQIFITKYSELECSYEQITNFS